jgi:hypothetical protein
MALEGNIAEFSLPEIMQLLSSQRKTGVLSLEQERETAALDFEEGQITGGYHSRRGVQEDLSGYLFKTGLVGEAELARAEEKQARRRVPLEEVLIEDGLMSEEDFAEVIRFKIQEIMDEVFTWVDGHYTFDVKARLYTKSRYPVRLSTDGFLMEGMRRMDEWLRIRKVFPDLGVMLVRDAPPPAGEVTPQQEKFLEFLGARHLSLEQLAEASGLGKFMTCQVAVELLETGSIRCQESRDGTGAPPAAAGARSQTGAVALMVRHLGMLVNFLSLYPFNHANIMSVLEEFFFLFDGLTLDGSGLSLELDGEGLSVAGRPVEDPLMLEFRAYLSQRRLESLAFLPQLKRDELMSFAFVLALPADFVESLGGIEVVSRTQHLHHVRIGFAPPGTGPSMRGEKMFVVPSRFLEILLDNPALSRGTFRIFQSLKRIHRLPSFPVSREAAMEIEMADQDTERIFGVYSRGGREKYIEKVIIPVMKLHPATRIAFIKRKLLDVRWPFPLDNILALSHNDFEKLERLSQARRPSTP